jgi:hypothetical protein
MQQSSHSHKFGHVNYDAAMLPPLPDKFNAAILTLTKQILTNANAILTLSQTSSNFKAEIISLSQSRF